MTAEGDPHGRNILPAGKKVPPSIREDGVGGVSTLGPVNLGANWRRCPRQRSKWKKFHLATRPSGTDHATHEAWPRSPIALEDAAYFLSGFCVGGLTAEPLGELVPNRGGIVVGERDRYLHGVILRK